MPPALLPSRVAGWAGHGQQGVPSVRHVVLVKTPAAPGHYKVACQPTRAPFLSCGSHHRASHNFWGYHGNGELIFPGTHGSGLSVVALAMRVHGPTACVGGSPCVHNGFPTSHRALKFAPGVAPPPSGCGVGVPDLVYGCKPPTRGPSLFLHAAGLGPLCSSGALG